MLGQKSRLIFSFSGQFKHKVIILLAVKWAGNISYPEVKWSEVKSLSHVQLFATPWTVAYQASPSMGFSRQEYWSGLPFPSPGDLPNQGIKPRSPALLLLLLLSCFRRVRLCATPFQADTLPSEPPGNSYIIALKYFYLQKLQGNALHF